MVKYSIHINDWIETYMYTLKNKNKTYPLKISLDSMLQILGNTFHCLTTFLMSILNKFPLAQFKFSPLHFILGENQSSCSFSLAPYAFLFLRIQFSRKN